MQSPSRAGSRHTIRPNWRRLGQNLSLESGWVEPQREDQASWMYRGHLPPLPSPADQPPGRPEACFPWLGARAAPPMSNS